MSINKDMAQKALLHARKYILLGSTHPSNNDCDDQMRSQLYLAVQAIRNECMSQINTLN